MSSEIRSTEASPRHTPIDRLLEEGVLSARQGSRQRARECFQRVITLDAENEEAWLWLATLAPSLQERLTYYEHVLSFNPDSRSAKMGVKWTNTQLSSEHQAVHRSSTSPTRLDSADRSSFSTQPRHTRTRTRTGAITKPPVRAIVIAACAFAVVLLTVLAVAHTLQLADEARIASIALMPAVVGTPTPTLAERLAPLWAEVDRLWEQRAWQPAIALLEQMYAMDATDEEIRIRLSSAHTHLGEELLAPHGLDEALTEFNRALRIYSEDEHLQRIRHQLLAYSQGRESYQRQDWDQAVAQLTPIFDDDPDFLDVRLMLYQAQYQLGLAFEQEEEFLDAKESYLRATAVYPQGSEASARLALVIDTLRMQKRIEVDVSQQHLTAWEKDEIVFSYVCSTGKPGTPTKRGTFEILDKIPEAYSSVWHLRMPWWLGIYWAGGSENGFHALPILSNGRTLWAGYLGTPISYGCIVLDTPAAKRLYDWVDIGTMVIIRN